VLSTVAFAQHAAAASQEAAAAAAASRGGVKRPADEQDAAAAPAAAEQDAAAAAGTDAGAGAGPVERSGALVHSAGVLMCSRTAGCLRPAGHQGWCQGHGGYSQRRQRAHK
jgi:hypothetical protein